MKLSKRAIIRIIIGLVIAGLIIVGVAVIAAPPSGAKGLDLSARLSELIGVAQVRLNAQADFNPVNDGYILKAIQQLQTEAQSKARLDLSTGSIVRLGPSTIFSLASPVSGTGGALSAIEMQVGRIWIVLKGGSLDVNTPRGLASVRGSYMSVWVQSSSNKIIVCCLEGSCTYQNDGGIVQLTTGQKIVSSDTSIKPVVQPMDQLDIKDWRDNSPEAASVISQVSPLVATSTPSNLPSVTPTP